MNKENINKGFSLIEIIVTLAIMAIVTVSAVSIFSMIKSEKIKSLAGKTNDAISDLRSKTLTKSGKYELIIRYDSSKGKYVAELNHNDIIESTEVLGNVGTIYCVNKSSGDEYELKSSDKYEIHLKYNKSDGSFAEIKCISGSTGADVGTINHKIYIEYAGLSKGVQLIEVTGKHSIVS